ncbi:MULTISPECIES: hypothetical protein [unclassified Bradyrhizobium]|uniref:hypothetical protein n=1 Tax=unclassified Bradyrhizobium TaxID=2631580 RepID=UPI00291611A1|nr:MULTISPECIES: hypothetical protein [unclassified Bradyrhizobium]
MMAGIETFLARRLELKVNKAKSAVARPNHRNVLGFSFNQGRKAAPAHRRGPATLTFRISPPILFDVPQVSCDHGR